MSSDVLNNIKRQAIDEFYHKIDLVCYASLAVGISPQVKMIQRNPTIYQTWGKSTLSPLFLSCEITCGKVVEIIDFMIK